eukprot:2176793-Alexandrium_andersonii.AAC.1
MLTSLEFVWSLRPRLRPGHLRPPPAGKPATGVAAGACDRNVLDMESLRPGSCDRLATGRNDVK